VAKLARIVSFELLGLYRDTRSLSDKLIIRTAPGKSSRKGRG